MNKSYWNLRIPVLVEKYFPQFAFSVSLESGVFGSQKREDAHRELIYIGHVSLAVTNPFASAKCHQSCNKLLWYKLHQKQFAVVIKGRLKELFFSCREKQSQQCSNPEGCAAMSPCPPQPAPRAPALSPLSALACAHCRVRICCSISRLISANLDIPSDQQNLSRTPRGHLRAEFPFLVQQEREKTGCSALCCVKECKGRAVGKQRLCH